MKVLDLAYDRIDKKLDELEVTDEYFRGLRAGLIDALELIDILDMELDGRLPAGDDVREHLNLPEPEPDWHDAPGVLARLDEWGRDELDVFTPAHEGEGHWVAIFSALTCHWSELRDVVPLYPKEGQDA